MLRDVRDRARVHRALNGVDVVVHAAAIKQVLTRDTDAYESVSTNILGTQAVIDAALDHGVHKSFLISSDKAAYPMNIYGSSKYCAEKLFVVPTLCHQQGGLLLPDRGTATSSGAREVSCRSFSVRKPSAL